MRALWAKSPATAKDLAAAVQAETQWNPKTVLTLINRLAAKGAVGFSGEARQHQYFPKVSERECVRVESRAFRERIFGGAAQPMLAHFVRETNLSEADIAELRRILDEKAAGARGDEKERP
jgi:BlaI family transcriptional regulator, penicillinase repressor